MRIPSKLKKSKEVENKKIIVKPEAPTTTLNQMRFFSHQESASNMGESLVAFDSRVSSISEFIGDAERILKLVKLRITL